MVRTLLNIQLLLYGMTYLMILEKLPILTNLKTLYYLGMEMNANVMHVKKKNNIKVFSIFILFIFIYFLAVNMLSARNTSFIFIFFYILAFITVLD
jgi:hypothetical protein